jgi:peptidyl-prolyl cis-trans isomerase B (cyclophilin B)
MITITTTVAAVIVVVVGVFYFTQRENGQPSAAPAPQAAPKTSGGPCEYTETPDKPAAKPAGLPADPNPTPAQGTEQVTLKTSQGDIPLTLNRAQAPCTVQNFDHLAQAKFFDNTNCHRLSTTDLGMLQCGDPTGSGSGGPGYQFKDEITPSLKYPRGTLAMANAGPNTNGSQFFLVFGDSPLPPNYTVFGSIGQSGLAVLDKIAQAGIANPGPDGTGPPKAPVTITQVTS